MSGKDNKDRDEKAEARKARAAAQLRRNLMRRKAQSRERASSGNEGATEPADEQGNDGDT